jgi:hypothetical protein
LTKRSTERGRLTWEITGEGEFEDEDEEEVEAAVTAVGAKWDIRKLQEKRPDQSSKARLSQLQ